MDKYIECLCCSHKYDTVLGCGAVREYLCDLEMEKLENYKRNISIDFLNKHKITCPSCGTEINKRLLFCECFLNKNELANEEEDFYV